MSQNLPRKHSALPAPIKLGVVSMLALILLVAVFAPLYLSSAQSAAPPQRSTGTVSADPTGGREGIATASNLLPRGKLWSDLGIRAVQF